MKLNRRWWSPAALAAPGLALPGLAAAPALAMSMVGWATVPANHPITIACARSHDVTGVNYSATAGGAIDVISVSPSRK